MLEVARVTGGRLIGLFTRNASGVRPVRGAATVRHDDPHGRDLVQFYEYFHGDTGADVGASHQTGWTGVVAPIIQLDALQTPQQLLQPGAKGTALRSPSEAAETTG